MKKAQLLNEIMGVPKVIDFWVDYFSLILSGMAKGIVSKDEIEESEITYTNKDGEEEEGVAYRGITKMEGKEFMDWVLKIGNYDDLKKLLNDPRFKQFPLYKPNLTLTLFFLPKGSMEAMEGRPDSDYVEASHSFNVTKNALSKIGQNQIFVNQNFKFQVYLKPENLENFNINFFKEMIKSTISHELTHAYEGYSRLKTSNDPFQGQESLLSVATRLADGGRYQPWKDFLYLIYLHLGFEINARVTEFYYNTKDKNLKTTEEFMTELKKSSAWRELKMLEDFNAEEFLNSILEDISKHKQTINRFHRDLIIRQLIENWDNILQGLNRDFSMLGVYKGKLMDYVPQKAIDNPYEFFKFFEKRFHKKADRFKRKLYRIGSLVLDKSLIS